VSLLKLKERESFFFLIFEEFDVDTKRRSTDLFIQKKKLSGETTSVDKKKSQI
jgi:hypothetical protein